MVRLKSLTDWRFLPDGRGNQVDYRLSDPCGLVHGNAPHLAASRLNCRNAFKRVPVLRTLSFAPLARLNKGTSFSCLYSTPGEDGEICTTGNGKLKGDTAEAVSPFENYCLALLFNEISQFAVQTGNLSRNNRRRRFFLRVSRKLFCLFFKHSEQSLVEIKYVIVHWKHFLEWRRDTGAAGDPAANYPGCSWKDVELILSQMDVKLNRLGPSFHIFFESLIKLGISTRYFAWC